MENKSGEFIPTRDSLLSRLKDWQDDESWREFFNIYRKLIFSTNEAKPRPFSSARSSVVGLNEQSNPPN
jgi:hypothetical protein